MVFKTGDKVKLKKGTNYYNQAPNLVGVVIEDCYVYGWKKIKWINPIRVKEDSYPVADLIKVSNLYDKLLE